MMAFRLSKLPTLLRLVRVKSIPFRSGTTIIGRSTCTVSSAIVPSTRTSSDYWASTAASLILFGTCLANIETKHCNLEESSNPLWPSGVCPAMVDRYVDMLLANPDINIKSVPDSAERVLYSSAVRITLNACYEALSGLHGMEFLGHRVELVRMERDEERRGKCSIGDRIDAVNVERLDALAEKLLENKAVNQLWIPDFIEKQVYVNCLRLVFTILEAVTETMCMELCGHRLEVSFEPSKFTQEISKEISKSIIDGDTLDALVDEAVAESLGSSSELVHHIYPYKFFLKALHRTLYSLMLGIMEDLLSQTDISVLEDSIKMKLVPNKTNQFKVDEIPLSDTIVHSLALELKEAKSKKKRAERVALMTSLVAAASLIALVRSGR